MSFLKKAQERILAGKKNLTSQKMFCEKSALPASILFFAFLRKLIRLFLAVHFRFITQFPELLTLNTAEKKLLVGCAWEKRVFGRTKELREHQP